MASEPSLIEIVAKLQLEVMKIAEKYNDIARDLWDLPGQCRIIAREEIKHWAKGEGVDRMREEIERRVCVDPVQKTTQPKPPTVAPVSGKPGGVRVVDKRTGRESLASVLLRVEVRRETLEEALSVWDQQGIRTFNDFADYLGMTLVDGGTDD